MTKNKNRVIRRLSGSVAALLLGTAATSAMAIVTQWTYTTDAIFTAATFTNTGATAGNFWDDDEISWGRTGDFCVFNNSGNVAGELLSGGGCLSGETQVSPSFETATNDARFNRSALTIGTGAPAPALTGGGPATGTVNTVLDGNIEAGDFGLGINLTHWNNPINAGFSRVASGTIVDTLTLTPVLPVAFSTGPSVDAPDVTFDFRFAETANAGPCADATATPCADLFGIVAVPTLNLSFDYLGQEYFASVLLEDGLGGAAPIGTLGVQECAAVNLAAGCQGFRTAEGAATTVQFAFAISTTPLTFVPAPAPLALLGLGVLGLGFARRRRA